LATPTPLKAQPVTAIAPAIPVALFRGVLIYPNGGWVFIDNLPVGHPVYNNYRADIASLFPGLQNSMGAVGYYYIDTTTLSNGLHTISSIATDSAGHA
jgi:hypothetical protein